MRELAGFFLLAAISAFAAAPVSDARTFAHRELRLGLLAHINGNDPLALKHFAKCRKLAAPKSPDAVSCGIYGEMFGKEKAESDGASSPEARRVYNAAVAAYKNGDFSAADKGWHDCLGLSVVATAVRNDCLAAIELIPPKRPESEETTARAIYLDGLDYYRRGLDDKAADAWTRCQNQAPRGSATELDCRSGLEKLEAHERALRLRKF
jgi:hypothetical protein